MRIKDLATRATKLLTGNAYMVFDNGTKVEKVDYAELAKQIITEYNTQTLAGSAQSVKSALDALNSNTYALTGGTKLSSAFDFNSLTTPGNYYCDGTISVTNGPSATVTGLIKVEHTVGHSDEYLRQTYYPHRATGGYFVRIRNNSTWDNWVKEPTRSEITALNDNMTKFTGNSSAGVTFTIPNSYRGKLITADSNGNRCGEWLIWATGTGAIGIKNTVTASLIEVTSEQNNKLKIVPTDSGSPNIIFENYMLVATKD